MMITHDILEIVDIIANTKMLTNLARKGSVKTLSNIVYLAKSDDLNPRNDLRFIWGRIKERMSIRLIPAARWVKEVGKATGKNYSSIDLFNILASDVAYVFSSEQVLYDLTCSRKADPEKGQDYDYLPFLRLVSRRDLEIIAKESNNKELERLSRMKSTRVSDKDVDIRAIRNLLKINMTADEFITWHDIIESDLNAEEFAALAMILWKHDEIKNNYRNVFINTDRESKCTLIYEVNASTYGIRREKSTKNTGLIDGNSFRRVGEPDSKNMSILYFLKMRVEEIRSGGTPIIKESSVCI